MDINVTDPKFYLDPYEKYEWLRENAPLYWDEVAQSWVLSRHADVVEVSKDAEVWSAEPSVLIDDDTPISIVCMDNPRHMRLRNLVNKGFTPRMVGLLEPKVKAILKERLDIMAQTDGCDLVEAVSVPLPLFIIAEMIGIPRDQFKQFHQWSDDLIGVTGADGDPVIEGKAAMAYVEYANYLKEEIFEARRQNPQDDLVSILVKAQEDGALAENEEAMENDELVMFMTLLLVAGNETTRNAISGGMEAFLEYPEQREILLERPELIECATEEILRYVAPISSFRRTATRETELYAQTIPKGGKVIMLYQAANRDPRVFENPEKFDITRDPNPHLAFGIGNHFCLGANLARMEIRLAIQGLMDRFPDMEYAPGARPDQMASTLFRGIKSMPVVYGG